MHVYQYIFDNIILFVVFWGFVVLLAVLTVIIYKGVEAPIWARIIGVLGGSTAIYFCSIYLVTHIFDRGYPVADPKLQTTDTLVDLVLIPLQVIAFSGGALRTLDTIIFNVCFSTILWLLSMALMVYKLRPTSEVGQ